MAFLEAVVRELGLRAEVIAGTAEEAASDPGLAGAHALATARALAPPATALRLIVPLVAPGGCGLSFVGAGATLPPEAEIWAHGLAIVRVDDESA